MIRFLQNDDEIAMVLGHEIAHQIANHIQRGQHEVMRGAMLSALEAKNKGEDDEETLHRAALKGATDALVSYSQQYEMEADRIGTILMMRAGYTPDKAINLLERFPKLKVRYQRHPSDPKRIAAMRLVAKQYRAAAAKGQTLAIVF
jgi:predicted Zn-dependent protease